MPVLTVDEAIELIRMEYAELPGLRLTFWQARCLWNLSQDQCERALERLTASGFLARTAAGEYVKARRPIEAAVISSAGDRAM
jgi:hypothetical protein